MPTRASILSHLAHTQATPSAGQTEKEQETSAAKIGQNDLDALHLWRRLVLPKKINHWSLTSLQQRLVKTGGRLVKHARYYWLLLAEGHLTRQVFGAILRRIWALPLPTG